jgi:PTS system nitrogen regulatory IIA component
LHKKKSDRVLFVRYDDKEYQMEVSIFELSEYLGVVPDTIERWVRQGKLPVSKRGAEYRFRMKELEKWASKHNISLDMSKKKKLEKKILAQEKNDIISLSTAVQNGGVYFDIQGKNVQDVLSSAVKNISQVPDEFKSELVRRLVERENALSTGIGNGIAIPHPREQVAYLSHPMVCVCFPKFPVDYNALDHQPVFVLFLILCPDLKVHLHLLSSLAYCLRDREFVGFLNTRPDPSLLVKEIERLQRTNPI